MARFNHIRDIHVKRTNTIVIADCRTITLVNTLAERLTYARELRGLTQKDLAKAAGCSQSAVGNVESGERESLRNLIDIARALEVSAYWLHDGRGVKPTKHSRFDERTHVIGAALAVVAREESGSYVVWPLPGLDEDKIRALPNTDRLRLSGAFEYAAALLGFDLKKKAA